MKIETLALCVDNSDSAYDIFRSAGTLKIGGKENEIACYDTDGFKRRENSRMDFPCLSDKELHLRIVPRRAVAAILNYNPSVVIAGQTKMSENLILSLKGFGFVCIRYSWFYRQEKGHNVKVVGRKILRGAEHGVSASKAGYCLDMPKEPGLVLEFLKDESIIESILEKDKNKFSKALDSFNLGKEKPIIKTSFFENIWAVAGDYNLYG